jgi:hypothetical protein
MTSEEAKASLHLVKAIKCPICLDCYSRPVLMLAPCSHLFCKGCLEQCLATKECCPMCKTPVRRREVSEAPEDVMKVLESFQAIIDKIDPEWREDIDDEHLQELISKQSIMMEKKKLQLRDKSPASLAALASPVSPAPIEEGLKQSEGNGKLEGNEQYTTVEVHKQNRSSDNEASGRQSRSEDSADGDSHANNSRAMVEKGSDNENPEGATIKKTEIQEKPAKSSTDEDVATPAPPIFKVGDTVSITDRCWIGVNKPGGPAFVTSVSAVEGEGRYYDVRYILDGRQESDILSIFVKEMEELPRSSRSRRTLTPSKDSITPLPVEQVHQEELNPAASSGGDKRKPTITSSNRRISRGRGRGSGETAIASPTIPALAPAARENKQRGSKRPLNSSRSVSLSTSVSDADTSDISFSSAVSGGGGDGTASASGLAERSDSVKRSRSVSSSAGSILQVKMHGDEGDDWEFKRKPIVMVLTSVDDATEAKVKSFVTLFNTEARENGNSKKRDLVTIVPNFDSHMRVTHVLSGRIDKKLVLQQRTMKAMQAIASGAWIVSAGWITESLKQKRIIDETSFEVVATNKTGREEEDMYAPRRARLDAQAHQGRCQLFRAHSVVFYGDFPSPGPQKSQLAFLVSQAGGKVVQALEELKSEITSENKVIVVTSAQEVENLRAGGFNEVDYHASLVDSYWVMDSITNYRVETHNKSLHRAKK